MLIPGIKTLALLPLLLLLASIFVPAEASAASNAYVGAAVKPGDDGYWLTTAEGKVSANGNSQFLGDMRATKLNRPVVGMASTPSGGGYWLVASDGGIFAFGDAAFFGSTGSITLNKPIVGMAATTSGKGYWLVASDGGIFAYGDAAFFGSTGSIRLNKPIVGMAPSPDGLGYWMVASDGGIFSYGNAAFYGSTGSLKLNQPMSGMTSTRDGKGYWLVSQDGGIFSFGAAQFYGSGVSADQSASVVAMVRNGSNAYTLLRTDGSVDAKVGDPSGDAATAPVPPFRANLTSYGAKCDGTTDDRLALQHALDDVNAKGGGILVVPSATCRIVETTSTTLSGPIVIAGESTSSTLALDTNSVGAFRSLFRMAGSNVSLQNLRLTRASDVYGVMISFDGASYVNLDHVVIDGKKDAFPTRTFHGIMLGGSATTVNQKIAITDSTITNNDYGLLQSNATQSTVRDVLVDNSTFTGNYADDLEFNSPSGVMTGVRVTNSKFSSNKNSGQSYGAGFGVGLANVQHALIQNNVFDGYVFEPVHIEDRTADVIVDSNTFRNAFTIATNYSSHVFIINGAHDITVSNNLFDTTGNTNPIWCVYAGAGGSSPQVSNISIVNNHYILRPSAHTLGNYGAINLTVSGEVVQHIS